MIILKEINLTHALIISTVIHFLSIFILNRDLPNILPDIIKDKPKKIEIEFEFYQAKAQSEKHIFIPQIPKNVDNNLENTPTKESIPFMSDPQYQEFDLDFQKEELEEEELSPSIIEQKEIKITKQKTSDSLKSEIDLKEVEKNSKIKWDYGNRIRTLVENIASLPENFNHTRLNDIVMVKISLNKKGELIHNTPLILKGDRSKYPEINAAAIKAVKKSSVYFPALPANYAKDEITLWLPIKFTNRNG